MGYIEKNAEYLEKQLFFLGAKVDQTELRQMMDKEKSFHIVGEKMEIRGEQIQPTLKLDRSKQGFYFLNNIEITVGIETGKESRQNFKVSKDLSFTLLESYRLMKGKSIFKEGRTIDPEKSQNEKSEGKWYYLDFNNSNKNGNAILRSKNDSNIFGKIEKLPIINYHIPQVKAKIHEDLKKGGQAYVLYEKNGIEEKRLIEVAAKYSSINEYDMNGKRLFSQYLAQTNTSNEVSEQQKTTAEKVTKTSSLQKGGHVDAVKNAPQKKRSRKAAKTV